MNLFALLLLLSCVCVKNTDCTNKKYKIILNREKKQNTMLVFCIRTIVLVFIFILTIYLFYNYFSILGFINLFTTQNNTEATNRSQSSCVVNKPTQDSLNALNKIEKYFEIMLKEKEVASAIFDNDEECDKISSSIEGLMSNMQRVIEVVYKQNNKEYIELIEANLRELNDIIKENDMNDYIKKLSILINAREYINSNFRMQDFDIYIKNSIRDHDEIFDSLQKIINRVLVFNKSKAVKLGPSEQTEPIKLESLDQLKKTLPYNKNNTCALLAHATAISVCADEQILTLKNLIDTREKVLKYSRDKNHNKIVKESLFYITNLIKDKKVAYSNINQYTDSNIKRFLSMFFKEELNLTADDIIKYLEVMFCVEELKSRVTIRDKGIKRHAEILHIFNKKFIAFKSSKLFSLIEKEAQEEFVFIESELIKDLIKNVNIDSITYKEEKEKCKLRYIRYDHNEDGEKSSVEYDINSFKKISNIDDLTWEVLYKYDKNESIFLPDEESFKYFERKYNLCVDYVDVDFLKKRNFIECIKELGYTAKAIIFNNNNMHYYCHIFNEDKLIGAERGKIDYFEDSRFIKDGVLNEEEINKIFRTSHIVKNSMISICIYAVKYDNNNIRNIYTIIPQDNSEQ